MYFLLPVAYLLSALLWRICSEPGYASRGWGWAALVASLLTLLLAGALNLRRQVDYRAIGIGLGLTALVTLLYPLELLIQAGQPQTEKTVLWPCEIACSGVGPYQILLGIHVGWLALPVLLAAGSGAFLAQRQEAHRRWLWLLLSALAGVSLYYIALSTVLRFICPYCLAVHTGVLACYLATLRGQGLQRRTGGLLLVLSFLLLHLLYHPGAYLLAPQHKPVAVELNLTPSQTRRLITLDRARSSGRIDAPYFADLIIDLQCQQCRQVVPELLASLRPLAASDRLHLSLRYRYPPRSIEARRLAELAIAASLSEQLDAYLNSMLGTPTALSGEADVDARLPEALASLAAMANTVDLGAPLNELLEMDQERLQSDAIRGLRSPILLLRRGGKEIGRWSGIEDTAAALAEFEALLAVPRD